MQALALLSLILVTGCWNRGAPAAPPRPSAPSSVERPPSARDAIGVIRRLASALESDDPAALDPLIDPMEGIRVWQAPGATMNVVGRITRGAGPPSQQIKRSAMNEYYREVYRTELASGLRDALARVDVDPPEPSAAVYQVRCETTEPAERAVLSTRPGLDPRSYPYYLDDGEPIDRDLGLVRFVMSRGGAVAVWLVERDRRLYVSDVFVDSPCDA